MRGVRGVAEEDHVAVMPRLVLHRDELAPRRLVGDELLIAEVLGEELLDVRDALLGARLVEACCQERCLVALDDERARVLVEAVRVHLEHPVRVLLEVEREGVELLLRPQPDVARAPQVQRRLERVCVEIADAALHAVARDDEVRAARDRLEVRDVGVEEDLHAELEASLGQDAEELLPRDAGEAMAVGPQTLPAIVNVDRGPVRERVRDRLVRRAIILFEIRERLVGEDDTPAERHSRCISLDDRDGGVGTRLLVEKREVETAGTTADANDVTALRRCQIAFFHGPLRSIGRVVDQASKRPSKPVGIPTMSPRSYRMSRFTFRHRSDAVRVP